MGLIRSKGTGQERPAPIASKLVLAIHVPATAHFDLECEPALQCLKLKRHRLPKPLERVLKLREEVAKFLVADRTVELSGEAVSSHDDRTLTPILDIARTNVNLPDEPIGVDVHTHAKPANDTVHLPRRLVRR
jgi:hypothetical protein